MPRTAACARALIAMTFALTPPACSDSGSPGADGAAPTDGARADSRVATDALVALDSSSPGADVLAGADAVSSGDDVVTATDSAPPWDGGLRAGGLVTPPRRDGSFAAVMQRADGTLRWSDAAGLARQTQLAGTVARYFDYTSAGDARHCTGASSYNGFGYVVSHYPDSAHVDDGHTGTTRWLLAGAHHALYEDVFTVAASGLGLSAGTMRVTVHWFFATGRSHPVYAITYDSSGIAANAYHGDTRSPYGEIYFEGARGHVVDGVAWGDRYRFETLGSPLTKRNGWDYSQPNVVPYALEWMGGTADAEMGLVQTQTQAQHAAGGYWFYSSWGTRSAAGPMPEDWNWPYQLNQYSFAVGETTSSTRLAWGMNFGAVGASRYARLGDDPDTPPAGSPSGHPYQSYSTSVVLGRHTEHAVMSQVAQVEAVQSTQLSAATGTVRARGPAGVGRTDEAAFAPAGYNALYGIWELSAAAGGALDATFRVEGSVALESPVVLVSGLSAAPSEIWLEGVRLTPNTDVFVTADGSNNRVWLTFPGTWRGAVRLVLR